MKKRTFLSLLTILPVSTIGCFSCSNSPKTSTLNLIKPEDLSTNLTVNQEYTSSAFDVEIHPTPISKLKDEITWHTDNPEIAYFNDQHQLVVKPIKEDKKIILLIVWVELKDDVSIKDEKILIFNVKKSIKLIIPADLSGNVTDIRANQEYTSSAFDVEINPTASISKDKIIWHTDNPEIANFNAQHQLVVKPQTQTAGLLILKVWIELYDDFSIKDEKILGFNVWTI